MIGYVMEAPDEHWVERVLPGHSVFLVKEKKYAVVEEPFIAPKSDEIAGRIKLRYQKRDSNQLLEYCVNEIWFVRANGRGMDNSKILLPITGQLPNHKKTEQIEIIRKLNQKVFALQKELDEIKNLIKLLEPAGEFIRKSKEILLQ